MVFGGIPHFVTSDRSSGNSLVPVYALPGCSQNFVYTDSKFGFPLTFARFFFIDSYCFIEIFSNKKLLNIQIDTFQWISIISNVVAKGAGCADPIYTSATAQYTMSIFEFCVVYILHYFQNKTKQILSDLSSIINEQIRLTWGLEMFWLLVQRSSWYPVHTTTNWTVQIYYKLVILCIALN